MDYSLQVYQNPKLGSQLIETNIAPIAKGWRRSIRLIGGYWLGNFTLEGDYLHLAKIFNGYIGYRIVETIGGQTTWEGLFYDIVLDDTREPILRVKCAGYAHTLNWRYLSVGDNTNANASAWIDSILSTDCEFVVTRNVSTNTLQVKKATDMKRRAWDEMTRIVAMGDGAGNFYKLKFTHDRKVLYNTVDMSPKYFVNGGLVRRKSLETMYNHVGGDYIDDSDAEQTLTPATADGSIVQFGRKELRLVENDVPQTAMESLRDLVLQDNAYPWGRVVSCAPEIQFFDSANIDNNISPWFIEPAVVRDVKYPYAGSEYESAYDDARDFLVDQIEVYTGRDGEPRISLQTAATEESDMLEAYYREVYGQKDDDDNDRGKKRIPRSERRGTKEYHDKYHADQWDEDQIQWWKDQGYDWTWEGRRP